ncbi:SH3 domain-containing protein [Azorhizobium doebereinerae]|uniref:SH3 domain-containing protein n=1 Tax=Azorhizobium doebereinerae TaxID=281091 RepID=UPI0004149B71|nr:SH3 domain-containing protein [Azorhizobium doebereinerae]
MQITWRHLFQTRAAAFALLLAAMLPGVTGAQAADEEKGTGLPVPRFVSLKADRVNVRNGPNRDQDVAWIFTRAGLPVEITAEFETWRRIRDADGAEGWVYHSMLSGRRTALVSPWSKDATVTLRDKPDGGARVVARLEPSVLGIIKTCDGKWCRIFGEGFDGFIEQNKLWGVYPNEKVD